LAWGSSNEVGLTLKATVGWGQMLQSALIGLGLKATVSSE